MRYLITTNALPTFYACGKCHILNHALQCKIWGLIGGQHNEAQEDLGCVATQAISPNAVCNPKEYNHLRKAKKGRMP
eukprot:7665453-Ditylum_brightwellii.AAC.1